MRLLPADIDVCISIYVHTYVMCLYGFGFLEKWVFIFKAVPFRNYKGNALTASIDQ